MSNWARLDKMFWNGNSIDPKMVVLCSLLGSSVTTHHQGTTYLQGLHCPTILVTWPEYGDDRVDEKSTLHMSLLSPSAAARDGEDGKYLPKRNMNVIFSS